MKRVFVLFVCLFWGSAASLLLAQNYAVQPQKKTQLNQLRWNHSNSLLLNGLLIKTTGKYLLLTHPGLKHQDLLSFASTEYKYASYKLYWMGEILLENGKFTVANEMSGTFAKLQNSFVKRKNNSQALYDIKNKYPQFFNTNFKVEYYKSVNTDEEHLNNLSSKEIKNAAQSKKVISILEKLTKIFKGHNQQIDTGNYLDTLHRSYKAELDQCLIDMESIKQSNNNFPKVVDLLLKELKLMEVFLENQKPIWPNEFSTVAQVIDKSNLLSQKYEQLPHHQIWELEFKF